MAGPGLLAPFLPYPTSGLTPITPHDYTAPQSYQLDLGDPDTPVLYWQLVPDRDGYLRVDLLESVGNGVDPPAMFLNTDAIVDPLSPNTDDIVVQVFDGVPVMLQVYGVDRLDTLGPVQVVLRVSDWAETITDTIPSEDVEATWGETGEGLQLTYDFNNDGNQWQRFTAAPNASATDVDGGYHNTVADHLRSRDYDGYFPEPRGTVLTPFAPTGTTLGSPYNTTVWPLGTSPGGPPDVGYTPTESIDYGYTEWYSYSQGATDSGDPEYYTGSYWGTEFDDILYNFSLWALALIRSQSTSLTAKRDSLISSYEAEIPPGYIADGDPEVANVWAVIDRGDFTPETGGYGAPDQEDGTLHLFVREAIDSSGHSGTLTSLSAKGDDVGTFAPGTPSWVALSETLVADVIEAEEADGGSTQRLLAVFEPEQFVNLPSAEFRFRVDNPTLGIRMAVTMPSYSIDSWELPPLIPIGIRRYVRMYPRHDGNEMSSAPRLFGQFK